MEEKEPLMDEKVRHDLAIAYAQVKLLRFQREYPKEDFMENEVRTFLKAYNYAYYQLEIEWEDLDECF